MYNIPVTAVNGDTEGTPVGILEACASGLPIISTLHGGIKDAVNHAKTGYLVEENNVENMANYMIQVCENPLKAKEMGLNGRCHIEYNYQQKNQIQKIYNSIKLSKKERC